MLKIGFQHLFLIHLKKKLKTKYGQNYETPPQKIPPRAFNHRRTGYHSNHFNRTTIMETNTSLTINEYLEDYDYGEGHPERLIRLMQAVHDYNEENDRSYPAKVTAESYIQWSKHHLKDGGDERAWSGGFNDLD